MVKIIQIAPNDIFHFRWVLYIFLTAVLFFLLAIIALLIYVSQIQSVTDQSGKKLYKYPSHTLLYISLSSGVVSLVFNIILLSYYIKIFQFKNSPALITFITLSGLSVVVVGVSMYYIFIVKSYCPDGQEYSDQFDRCVPICPPGSLLDEENFVCIQGCRSNEDCPDKNECILHECCDLSTHTVINNFCCVNENVHCLDSDTDVASCPSDKLYCCSSNKVCLDKDGKPTICCLDPTAKCYDRPDGKGQYCAIRCGTSDVYCDTSELCLETDIVNGTPTFSCEKIDSTCSPSSTTQTVYYPGALNNFYPAYNVVHSDQLDSVLTCNPFKDDQSCQTALDNAFARQDSSQDNAFGWICGANPPVNFEYHKYTGGQEGCPKQFLISALAIPGVTDKANLQYDSNDVYFNLRNDRSETRSTNGLGTQPITSFKTTQPYNVSSTVMSSKPSHSFVTGKLEPHSASMVQGTCGDSRVSNVYRQSCDDNFGPCEASNICPFDVQQSGFDVDCVYDTGKGAIIPKTHLQYCCTIEDGNYGCHEYTDEKPGYLCSADKCPSVGCGDLTPDMTGHFSDGVPVAACWWYGNLGGEGGDCPHEEWVDSNLSSIRCPKGFKTIVTLANGYENTDACRRSNHVDCSFSDGTGCEGDDPDAVSCSAKTGTSLKWTSTPISFRCCDPQCLRDKFGTDITRLTGLPCSFDNDDERNKMIQQCCGSSPYETQVELGSDLKCHVTSGCYGCANKISAANDLSSRLTDWNKSQLGL